MQTKLHKKRESSVSCSDKSDHCVSLPFANSGILSITGEIIGHKPVIKLNRFEAVMFWVVEATRCRKHEKIERNIKTIKDRFLRGLCLSKQDSKPHYFSIKK